MNDNNYEQQWYTKTATTKLKKLLWSTNLLILIVFVTAQLFSNLAAADANKHYAIDDDNISDEYWSSTLPKRVTKFYETTLPNFFGTEDNTKDPSVSISIQHMDETHPALSDDEKQEIIKPFEGDPLDRKAIVIEVPLN